MDRKVVGDALAYFVLKYYEWTLVLAIGVIVVGIFGDVLFSMWKDASLKKRARRLEGGQR